MTKARSPRHVSISSVRAVWGVNASSLSVTVSVTVCEAPAALLCIFHLLGLLLTERCDISTRGSTTYSVRQLDNNDAYC